MAKILYQGHGSFRMVLADGTVVYIDPYAGEGYDLPADVILCTHQHADHTAFDLMPHAQDMVLWQNMDAHPSPDEYLTTTIRGMRVEAVEAFNSHHPRNACVGYIVDVDGASIYFAGDTSTTPTMDRLAPRGLDIVFLPTDGSFNMGPEEAAACAEMIGAKRSVPVHMAPGKLFSEEVAERFQTPSRFIMRPGDEVEL